MVTVIVTPLTVWVTVGVASPVAVSKSKVAASAGVLKPVRAKSSSPIILRNHRVGIDVLFIQTEWGVSSSQVNHAQQFDLLFIIIPYLARGLTHDNVLKINIRRVFIDVKLYHPPPFQI